MANSSAVAGEQQHPKLLDAILRHKPIDKWLQDEHRGLLSMSDHRGWRPLTWAAFFGNAGAIVLLLEAGVDADQLMIYGNIHAGERTNRGSPLYFACLQGHTECAELLLGAGASVDLADVHGSTPLYITCLGGNIQLAQLLSAYGANRVFSHGSTAERISARFNHHALAVWLALSREWSPLHHLEVLSPERTRALLRGGTDLHLSPSTGDTATPLERAHQLAPTSASASLVVRAAGPWSTTTHELFGDAERARAVMLAHSLYHVYLRRMEHGGWQAVDFASHVLPHALVR